MWKPPGAPLVTVIIPAYNAQHYIAEALRSVLSQSFSNVEVLVIDDGSTDATARIAGQFSDLHLRVIRKPNGGVSSARNEGLRAANGRYITFLDADDRWRPQMLERTVSILESHAEVVAVFTNFVRFRQNGSLLSEQFPFYPELPNVPTTPADIGAARVVTAPAFETFVRFGEIPAFTPAMVFRASAIEGLRFDEELTLCEDTHFCLRAFLRGAVAFTPEVLVEVRRHGANATTEWDASAAKLDALQKIETSGLGRRRVRTLRRRIGREWVNMGRSKVREGDFRAGLIAYSRAFGCGFRRSALFRAAALPLQILGMIVTDRLSGLSRRR